MKIRYNNQIVNLKLSYILEFILINFLYILFKILPFKIEWNLCKPIGVFLWKIDKKHRNISIDNLKKAFPEKSNDEIAKISKQVFINMIAIFFEFINIKKILRKKNIARNFTVEGNDILERLLKKGRGVIAITSHFGNWEIEGGYTVSLGYKLNALYYQQNNFLADYFFNKIRKSIGIKLIYKKYAFRKTLEALKNNEIVAFLSDQDARRDGIFVKFFNQWTSTVKGPIYFALKTNTPVIIAFLVREGYNKFKLIIKEIKIEKTGDIDKDIYVNTQKWSYELEKIIRKYPEQWFWVHRRWKTKKYE